MNQVFQAILRTLVYADVFDYPLTRQEISKFLISESPQKIPDRPQGVAQKNGFYFLAGREKIAAIRKKREKWSKDKLKIAQRIAGWLKLIPTIKMVAVTGALAMENSDKNDDIDLLIVTGRHRLWLTRLLTVLLVELVARRRRPGDLPAGRQGKNVRDKICLNMFLDEDHLAVPKNEQDLFSAHEVCQLRPLWSKDHGYQNFLDSNLWVKKFLANWKP